MDITVTLSIDEAKTCCSALYYTMANAAPGSKFGLKTGEVYDKLNKICRMIKEEKEVSNEPT